jgi:hypothetical protein
LKEPFEEPEEGLITKNKSPTRPHSSTYRISARTPPVRPVGRAEKIRDKDERGEEAREDRRTKSPMTSKLVR